MVNDDPLALEYSADPLEFLLQTMSGAFKISTSQATALISNNQRYLIYICIKGMKGNFTKLIDWYALLLSKVDRLVDLLEDQSNDYSTVYSLLKNIKYGLFSKNADVANSCGRLLAKMFQSSKSRAALFHRGSPCHQMMLEWFVGPENARIDYAKLARSILSFIKAGKLDKQLKDKDLNQISDLPGIHALLVALKMRQNDFIE